MNSRTLSRRFRAASVQATRRVEKRSLWARVFDKARGAGTSWLTTHMVWPAIETRIAKLLLRKIPGYYGTVGQVAIHPLRGTLIVRALNLQRVSGSSPLDKIFIDRLQVRFDWKRLLRGIVVCEIELQGPLFEGMMPEDKAADQTEKKGENLRPSLAKDTLKHEWQPRLEALPPFCISRLVVERGAVRWLQAGVNFSADAIFLRALNITNSTAFSSSLMATAEGRAQIMTEGTLTLHAQGYPFAKVPTFNADLKLEELDLRELKTPIEKATGIVIDRGVAEIYAEGAAAEGKFHGYAKPIIKNLEIAPQRNKGFGVAFKVFTAKMANLVFRNRKTDSLATKVEFDGAFDDPQIGVAAAIYTFVKNAFFSALFPDLEHTVGFSRAGRKPTDVKLRYDRKGKNVLGQGFELFSHALTAWSADQSTRMAASLSYYTAFSIAPLLILVMAAAGIIFGREAAQGQIVGQLRGLLGDQSAMAIQSMIQAADKPSTGMFASIVGIISLFAGGSRVVSELKAALNRIWKTDDPSGIGAIVKQNAKIYAIVAGIGFLLLVSLVVTASMAAVGTLLGGALPIPEIILHFMNFVLSLVVITVLFACMFKFLPNTVIEWHDVWIGSAVTSLLFTLGKLALGIYLGKGTVGSSYGAAGAVLVALLWVYYSGLIVYFGAEFTKVYAERYGSRANDNATTVPRKKVE